MKKWVLRRDLKEDGECDADENQGSIPVESSRVCPVAIAGALLHSEK